VAEYAPVPASVTAATWYVQKFEAPHAVSVYAVVVPPVEIGAENGPPLTERWKT
jgi:hypothetical protein